jgi:hypothetical protein
MKKSLTALLLITSLFGVNTNCFAGPKKKPKSKSSSSSNLKESFRAIGHGFRDAGRAVGRDAKAATKAVKESEKGKKKK